MAPRQLQDPRRYMTVNQSVLELSLSVATYRGLSALLAAFNQPPIHLSPS